jgi:hypothetical protein
VFCSISTNKHQRYCLLILLIPIPKIYY